MVAKPYFQAGINDDIAVLVEPVTAFWPCRHFCSTFTLNHMLS